MTHHFLSLKSLLHHQPLSYSICETLNIVKDKKNKSSQFSLEYLIISVIIAVCISLIVAYVMSSGDESVLTDNFWDPIQEQSPLDT